MKTLEGVEWLDRLLTNLFYSCSEPGYVQTRQGFLREHILEKTDAHPGGRKLLRSACLKHLNDDDATVVRNAVSCLFVVGEKNDTNAVEPLLNHSDPEVRKATKTCLFEIRKREATPERQGTDL